MLEGLAFIRQLTSDVGPTPYGDTDRSIAEAVAQWCRDGVELLGSTFKFDVSSNNVAQMAGSKINEVTLLVSINDPEVVQRCLELAVRKGISCGDQKGAESKICDRGVSGGIMSVRRFIRETPKDARPCVYDHYSLYVIDTNMQPALEVTHGGAYCMMASKTAIDSPRAYLKAQSTVFPAPDSLYVTWHNIAQKTNTNRSKWYARACLLGAGETRRTFGTFTPLTPDQMDGNAPFVISSRHWIVGPSVSEPSGLVSDPDFVFESADFENYPHIYQEVRQAGGSMDGPWTDLPEGALWTTPYQRTVFRQVDTLPQPPQPFGMHGAAAVRILRDASGGAPYVGKGLFYTRSSNLGREIMAGNGNFSSPESGPVISESDDGGGGGVIAGSIALAVSAVVLIARNADEVGEAVADAAAATGDAAEAVGEAAADLVTLSGGKFIDSVGASQRFVRSASQDVFADPQDCRDEQSESECRRCMIAAGTGSIATMAAGGVVAVSGLYAAAALSSVFPPLAIVLGVFALAAGAALIVSGASDLQSSLAGCDGVGQLAV